MCLCFALFVVFQSLSCISLFATPWTTAHQASLSFTISRACSDSFPLSQWCHLTISSSVVPFSCLQSFPASGSFLMGQLFESDGQSIGASVSASVFPMNIQDWFPLGMDWFELLAVQGTLKSLLQYHSYSVINFYQNGFTLLKVFYFKCNFLLIGMLFDGIYSESRKTHIDS